MPGASMNNHFKFTSMSCCISVTYISIMQNPKTTPEHLIGISSWLVQTDQWPQKLTFIRLCQSLCIDIDTCMHQPHSSRGKLSINVENNVIGFQDCRLYAHYCIALCAIHAEFKMSSSHFWLGAKWQTRIFHLLKRWLCVWPYCHPVPFALFFSPLKHS